MEQSKLLKIFLLPGVCVVLASCGSGDFNYGKVHNIIERSPMHLDAEYVMLTPQQVDCGVQHDLWDAPSGPDSHQIAHLTQKARDLKFSDDVSVGDMKRPYAQVRGDFSLAVNGITSDREGPEQNTRLVQTKIGVTIRHSCFGDALPVMGVRKGDFTQDASPVLLFRYDDGWHVESIVH